MLLMTLLFSRPVVGFLVDLDSCEIVYQAHGSSYTADVAEIEALEAALPGLPAAHNAVQLADSVVVRKPVTK